VILREMKAKSILLSMIGIEIIGFLAIAAQSKPLQWDNVAPGNTFIGSGRPALVWDGTH